MFADDTSDLTFTSGPRLLSESPPPPDSSSSRSHTGHGGADLSLSELSLQNRSAPRSFDQEHSGYEDESSIEVGDDTIGPREVNNEEAKKEAARAREEKLQRDLFILRKLNSSFAMYNDVLRDTQTGTERVAEQLADTDALLNKYINILDKSEAVTRLIFDERWEGAEQDEEILEREYSQKIERQKREEAERAAAAKREKERLEREEKEEKEREEKERLAAERGTRGTARGTVRGVRGTRASMRGVRGASAARGGMCTSRSDESCNSFILLLVRAL
ncbi:hypothetical protein HWV62_14366 [Athelia sp. TMB]|nr:hypothetical protein HWV62_14366 [Athelia sp. TMB]